MAACWLGEHVNSVAGEYAWKPWEHKMGPAAEAGPGLLESAPSTGADGEGRGREGMAEERPGGPVRLE